MHAVSGSRWLPRHVWFFTLLLGIVSSAPLRADELSHEQARMALQQGHILPLHQVLDGVARDYPGQVMKVELERERPAIARTAASAQSSPAQVVYVYEIRLLQPDGRVLKLEVNAASGQVIKVKRKEP